MPEISRAAALPLDVTRDQVLGIFEYDRSEPLCLMDVSEPLEEDGVTVRDVVFSSSAGTNVDAWLVAPDGPGPFAAIVFLHWLGHYDNNRDEFLAEARGLARRGVVSLLPTRLFPGETNPTTDWRIDRQSIAAQTIELRRSLDLLVSLPGVDADRLAFVGHDYGAMAGVVLAAVDRRLKAVALMAPDADWANWFYEYAKHFGIKPADRAEYGRAMKEFDTVALLPAIAPTPVLLQFSGNDSFIPTVAADRVAAAAAEPKRAVTYPKVGHDVQAEPQATADRDAWLSEHLGLSR
jgi:dienelactone hydrolase